MSQELDSNVSDQVKQKGFYLYEYMRGFAKFKEELSSKEKFSSLLTGKKLVAKKMDMFLMFEINLK